MDQTVHLRFKWDEKRFARSMELLSVIIKLESYLTYTGDDLGLNHHGETIIYGNKQYPENPEFLPLMNQDWAGMMIKASSFLADGQCLTTHHALSIVQRELNMFFRYQKPFRQVIIPDECVQNRTRAIGMLGGCLAILQNSYTYNSGMGFANRDFGKPYRWSQYVWDDSTNYTAWKHQAPELFLSINGDANSKGLLCNISSTILAVWIFYFNILDAMNHPSPKLKGVKKCPSDYSSEYHFKENTWSSFGINI